VVCQILSAPVTSDKQLLHESYVKIKSCMGPFIAWSVTVCYQCYGMIIETVKVIVTIELFLPSHSLSLERVCLINLLNFIYDVVVSTTIRSSLLDYCAINYMLTLLFLYMSCIF